MSTPKMYSVPAESTPANWPPELVLELLLTELESPLTSISSCAKILENPNLATPEQAVPAVVPLLHGSVEHITGILDNIRAYLDARHRQARK